MTASSSLTPAATRDSGLGAIQRRGLVAVVVLAFVGLATFHRVLQTGIEDLTYAHRIAQLRHYYFDHAPELAGYLPNPAEPWLPAPGLGIRLRQQFVTVAGMVAVITAVLSGSAGGCSQP